MFSGLFFLNELSLSLFFFSLLHFLDSCELTGLFSGLSLTFSSHRINLSLPLSLILLGFESCLDLNLLILLLFSFLLLFGLVHLFEFILLGLESIFDISHSLLMFSFFFSALGCSISIGGNLNFGLFLCSYSLLLGLSFNLSKSLKFSEFGLLFCLRLHKVSFNTLGFFLCLEFGSIFFRIEGRLWARVETINLL